MSSSVNNDVATLNAEFTQQCDASPCAVLIDAKTRLGECILWCEREACLYWTDIEACKLNRWEEATSRIDSWAMPERLGSFALCDDSGQILLGLASGIALFDLATGRVGPLVPVEADQPTTRINDGRCDAQGRFVFGTFNLARGGGAIGHFYRVSGPDLSIEKLPLPGVTVANGLAFSPDGGRIYFADSPTGEIRHASYHADGSIGPWSTFVRFASGDGFPDGAAVDAEGGVWSAHWDGACVVRYSPGGLETDRIDVPVTHPTCVTFAGRKLKRLVVTTATVRLNAKQLLREPYAGAILELNCGYQGVEERRFVLENPCPLSHRSST